MFNPHLANTQAWIAVLNGLGATMAMVINVLAYRRTGRGGAQVAYAVTAVLAGVYVFSYGALTFTDMVPADWSNVMRGVSLLTWPCVWSIHAAAKVFSKQPQRWADAVLEVVQQRLESDS